MKILFHSVIFVMLTICFTNNSYSKTITGDTNSELSSPLTVISANLPFEVITWDIDKAYPGVEYNFRLGVRGGTYPYIFQLIEGPTGLSLNERTGEISWIPTLESSGNLVKILITDKAGNTINHQFSIDVIKDAFRFISPTGLDINDGSEENPWATMAYANAHAGGTDYVYVKKGTYHETFTVSNGTCGRFLAYPGDSVTVVGTGTSNVSICITASNGVIFQGFTFDANNIRWFFSVNAGANTQNIIWRKNTMHNVYSNDEENPAFIFFWDGSQKPINGQVHYKNIVIQENVFYDLDNINNHGASVTSYDVQDMLYEDNIVYDVGGRGVQDKDDGYKNTFRNNVFHDCTLAGIVLLSQGTQGLIEINNNLVEVKNIQSIQDFQLIQNYPNPFSYSTTISFEAPESGYYNISVYDFASHEIAVLLNGTITAGMQQIDWNGTNAAGQYLGSGIYFYQLKSRSSFIEMKKMILIK